ncbi:hypothetical protein [Bradyrhizobium macuxiense]|nr:hypothetical protein [Bradyrhizobium macuxiense]
MTVAELAWPRDLKAVQDEAARLSLPYSRVLVMMAAARLGGKQ